MSRRPATAPVRQPGTAFRVAAPASSAVDGGVPGRCASTPPDTTVRKPAAGFRTVVSAACLLLSSLLGGAVASAQLAITPAELEGVGVREQLDRALPKDAVFRDHTGKRVRLGDYFDGKRPTVLTLAYASCKVVCSMVLGAELEALKAQSWSLGEEYRALTISIDARETPQIAAKKRRQMLALYGRAGEDWDFLVGDEHNIRRVAAAVGFQYRYDARQDQFAHPAVLMIVKPSGELARYLYGLEFSPSDVRLGLLEAAQGRSISTLEKMILYCYMYDPIGAKYVLVAKNVMRLGGALTVLLLGGFLLLMWRRERRARRAAAHVAQASARADADAHASDGHELSGASAANARAIDSESPSRARA